MLTILLKKSACLFYLCLFTFIIRGYSQITVTPTSTGAALAASLVGPGVTVSNPVLTCAALANGTFTVTPGTIIGGGPSTWGIGTGVVLATGKVASAAGTQATLANSTMGTAGDAALTVLAGAATHDACILEFDIIPTGDTIKFDYIFGSEEYNHSTCGPYNDAFAFFISGPGIVGTQNMALVPGTTIPVTVNSVNSGIPGAGYTLANCTAMGAGSPFSSYFDNNSGGANFTMDGFTKKLTALHNVIPCNTYHLKLTIADAGNSQYDSEVFIKQGSISSSTVTSYMAVCAGSSTTLTGTPAGGTWSTANAATATVAATTGVVTGLSAGTVDITYTTGAGCYAITSLTVNALPVIGAPSSTCIGSSVIMSATPAGGTWSGGTPGIATVTSFGLISGIAVGSVPVTYVDPLGCSSTGVFSVVNLTAITGPTSVCQGATITPGNPTPGGVWSTSNASIATVNPLSGSVTGLMAGSATITYSLGGGCEATENINVLAPPAPPVTVPVQFCQDVVASALTASGSNLLWYTASSGGVGNPVAPVPATATPGTATWYVSQTLSGCESPRTPITVTINPALTFHITGPAAACKNDTLTFGENPPVASSASYLWTLSSGMTLLTGSSLSAASVAAVANAITGQVVHLYIVDTLTGCSATDSLLINISQPPTAWAYTPQDACLGDTINLSLSGHSSDAYTYIWKVDGVDIGSTTAFNVLAHNSNTGGPFRVSWNTPGLHIISLQSYENGGGCVSETTYDTIKVHALPDAAFSYKAYKSTPCLNDSVFFAARTFDYSYTYTWTPAHLFYNKEGNSIWGLIEKMSSDITLTVTDPFGCTANTTQTITADACCKVVFPTGFTPNKDGKNDRFRPVFVDQGRNITNGSEPLPSYHAFHSFRIENRWGQTVFETTNNNPEWDGTFNGVPQDMGVYYYYLKFDCNGVTLTQTGDVTLIR